MSALDERLVGAVLADRYTIDAAVGDETLGRVFEARARVDGRRVHVKVLPPHLAADPEKFARFGREFTATRMLKHPNTLEVLDWGEHEDLHFLVFEHVVTHTLQTEIDAAVLDPRRAAEITGQVAAALDAAHAEGIVHRNLSPVNILIVEGVQPLAVKVRDFGLARLEDDAAGSAVTQAAARVGHVAYMAPEYIEIDEVGPKGDVYALGIVLYQMLTGQQPFKGKAREVLRQHMLQLIPLPSGKRMGLPDWCDRIVVSMCTKDPSLRPSARRTAELLVTDADVEIPALGLAPVPPPPRIEPKTLPASARLSLLALGAAIAVTGTLMVCVAAAFALFLWSWTPPPGEDAAAAAAADPPEAAPPEPAPAPEEAADDDTAVEQPDDEPDEAGEASPEAPAVRPRQRPRPAPPVQAVGGRLQVRANRRVMVRIDGKAMGYTPLDVPVAPGAHRVHAALPGQPDSTQEAEATVGVDEIEAVRFTF